MSKNLPIAKFVRKVSEGKCPLMLDLEKVETGRSEIFGVFRTKTGGTSKEPKSVLRTSKSWIKSFEVINSFQQNSENYLIFGDLTHSLALYGMLEALYLGHKVHHVQKLKSEAELKLSVKFEPTFVYITPTQIRFISSFFITLPSTLNVYIGGGRLNFQTREMAKQIFPNATLHLFYGSSETSFITISDEFTPVESVGKAFPNVEIKLEKNGPNKNRIWVKSEYLFLKYANGSNQNLFRQDDWLTIGEYGKIDKDGYLFLLSEDNSRITIADNTMEIYEIEDKLKTVENVIDAAVWKIENKLSGHRIVAAVATNGEVHSDRLYDALDEIKKIFKPKKIYKISLNEWPLLPSGKTDIRALKSHYHEQ
tara:strand:- start:1944 stop:3041 length:1098 start_codon:yes stop_codon:yes gene_type:complete